MRMCWSRFTSETEHERRNDADGKPADVLSPEMAAANSTLWGALEQRLRAKGVDTADIKFDNDRRPVPDGIGPRVFFTQICGYPLFKHYRDHGRLLANTALRDAWMRGIHSSRLLHGPT